jgi:predicted Fe-Mo cluster-binding NifX family protein
MIMNIAITAKGETLESEVDPRFGRAAKFIIYDPETGEFAAMDNAQNLNAAQGAGIQSAQNVINTGSKVLLTGHCGPKAFRTLAAGEVTVYTNVEGTVKEAVDKYLAGELDVANSADVEGHWM